MSSDSSTILSVEDLGKAYRWYPSQWARLAEVLTGRPHHEPHWVFRHLGFQMQAGEAVGVIGKNGAGKSTLLKMLSGLAQPTEGRIVMHGSVASILELGIGLHADFTGIENARQMALLQGIESILGYTCVNDVTALDLLQKDPSFPQWTRAKGCDTFGPIGPCVVVGLDWSLARVRTLVGGRERQNYPLSDMILPPERIVSLLSQEMTLQPGDVIACGTSLGVLPMRPGSVVEVMIDGIGTLRNVFEPQPDAAQASADSLQRSDTK